jgi:hypothetical protein
VAHLPKSTHTFNTHTRGITINYQERSRFTSCGTACANIKDLLSPDELFMADIARIKANIAIIEKQV